MHKLFAVAATMLFVAASGGTLFAQSCPKPVITIVSGTNPACPGDSIRIDAGPGYSSYQWSTGQPVQAFTWGSSSNYTVTETVTVTDANGCTATSDPITLHWGPLTRVYIDRTN